MKFGSRIPPLPHPLLIAAAFVTSVVPAVSPAQTQTVLYNFSDSTGSHPLAGVVEGARSGNLYGSTDTGGSLKYGVVFCLTRNGQYVVLHNFSPSNGDGNTPAYGVTIDPLEQSLFGNALAGGTTNSGTIYRLDATGKYSTVHSFTGGAGGTVPQSTLALGSHGNLFGTTELGGADNKGEVFKFEPSGQFTVVHSFTGNGDGGLPYSGVTFDAAGNLYGTTFEPATVYKIDPTGHETVLHVFDENDFLLSGVVADAAGNIFGTTEYGGDFGNGVVFKLDPQGNETVLHSFSGSPDGANPYGALVFDAAGNLYGAAFAGGTLNQGVIFKVDAATHATSVVYSFSGPDGATPNGELLLANGYIIGTTYLGGANGAGVIYKLSLQP